jgi:hypothetical protein
MTQRTEAPSRHPRARAGHPRGPWAGVAVGAVLALAGCASPPPIPGDSAPTLQARWGAPTATYADPAGGEGARLLEYASGPYGRTTWMVAVDAAGRVLGAQQVLTEASFLAFQQAAPGLTRDGVLRLLGRPGERQRLARVHGEIWSWRYPTNDCLWFQATLDAEGRVLGSGYATDPACDGGPAHD